MPRKKKYPIIGFTPVLWSVKYRGWTEAYGYLGLWYKSYRAAKWQIDFLMRNYPEEYTHWRIDRIVLDEDHFPLDEDPRCGTILAQSKDAPPTYVDDPFS